MSFEKDINNKITFLKKVNQDFNYIEKKYLFSLPPERNWANHYNVNKNLISIYIDLHGFKIHKGSDYKKYISCFKIYDYSIGEVFFEINLKGKNYNYQFIVDRRLSCPNSASGYAITDYSCIINATEIYNKIDSHLVKKITSKAYKGNVVYRKYYSSKIKACLILD
jgi:hypothetical protein